PDASQPASSEPTVHSQGKMTVYFEDADKKKEGDAKKEEPAAKEEAPSSCGSEAKSCGSEASTSCGSEAPACGSEASCCSECCCDDCALCIDHWWPFTCCCKPGDPCTLEKHLTPCCKDVTYGGWVGFGMYTNNDPLSFHNNDLLSFWDRPNELNLDQAWLWL